VRPNGSKAEKELARLAGASHGVVTRGELLRAGVTVAEIKHRVRAGSLLRVHRGVYRVGHKAPSVEARYLAAVRACGPGALLSGRAAGYLLGLLKGSPPAPEVTIPTQRRVRGVATRRAQISPPDATIVRGIPVTTVACTIVDLAAVLTADDLARVCHEATIRYATTPAQVEAVLVRRPNAKGAAGLRGVLRGDVPVTLSALERRFLAVLTDAALLLPQTNRPAGRRWVNCRWPDQRLTVELDSYRYHHSRHAWQKDLDRERQARARGDAFRRYTYSDVFEDPRFMLEELRRLVPHALRPEGRPATQREQSGAPSPASRH